MNPLALFHQIIKYLDEEFLASVLLSSKLFDSEAYLDANPDIDGNDVPAVIHYLRHGFKDMSWMDPKIVAQIAPTLPNGWSEEDNALLYYIFIGSHVPQSNILNNTVAEYIVGQSIFFDPEWYCSTYPDVVRAGADPAKHYCYNGWREGRNPSASFSTCFYQEYFDITKKLCPLLFYELIEKVLNPQSASYNNNWVGCKTVVKDKQWGRILTDLSPRNLFRSEIENSRGYFFTSTRWRLNLLKHADVAEVNSTLEELFIRTHLNWRLNENNHDSNFRYGITVCLIAKNEGPYIEEWLKYNKWVGVDHVIIYDNNTEDDMAARAKSFVEEGYVEYIKFPPAHAQIEAYNDALRRYRYQTKYLLYIDADEFIYIDPSCGHDFRSIVDDIMEKYPDIGGIGLNWHIFGSSGHKVKPGGGVLENYLHRADVNYACNNHIKTIADPRKVLQVVNPHFPCYIGGYHAYASDGSNTVNGAFNIPVVSSPIHVNHYLLKSEEEFLEKKKRGRVSRNSFAGYWEIHDRNEVYDDSMLRFVNSS